MGEPKENRTEHHSTASLPDRAVRSTGEDLLNRGVFAEALANQILNAPVGQTLRLGVYGGWGEGKTSVLELMRLRLTAEKQICVWITPWTAAGRAEVMEQIIDQLREQLKIEDKSLKRAKHFASLAGATTTAAQDGTWWTKTAAQLFAPAVQSRFAAGVARESERFFEVVQEHLNGRRVIVFIDDIDRVKPDLVPDLLLTLREALDQPNFFYVMALAPEIIERGLSMVHHGWGTAGDFLEKIVEYPRYLPVATDDEIEFFIRKSIDALGVNVDGSALRLLIPLLPRNPRKMKLYLRFLASLHGVLQRFDPAEIDLHMLYTVQLLRLEFPEEARAIAKDGGAINDLEQGYMLELMESKRAASSDVPKEADPRQKYLDKETSLQQRKERFNQLYNAIRRRDALLRGSHKLVTLFALADEPPLFTWKELNEFIPRFAAARATKKRRRLIEAQIKHDGIIDPARARAFFDLTLQVRQAALGQASEMLLDTDRATALAEAATLTDVLDVFVQELRVFESGILSVVEWKALLGDIQRWSHFNHPEDYAALRKRERELVTSSVEAMTDEVRVAALDQLGPLHDFDLQGSASEEFQTFLASLKRSLEQRAVAQVMRNLVTPDGLEAYWGERGSLGMKDLLFRNSSSLFRDAGNRTAFDALAGRAGAVPSIQQNFVELTRMLFYGAMEGGSFPRDEARRMIQDADLMKTIWSAALATPLNPRMAGGLRERRLRLIKDGVIDQKYADKVLAIPEWWQVLEGTFFK